MTFDHDLHILRTALARISMGTVISFEEAHRAVWHLVNMKRSGDVFHEICIALWELAAKEPHAATFWHKVSTIRNVCLLVERTESQCLKFTPPRKVMYAAAICRIVSIRESLPLRKAFQKLARNVLAIPVIGKSKRRWADMC